MDATNESDAGVKSWPGGIYAITLFVENLDATRQFYQMVFDLPIVFEDGNSAVFKFGSSLINLLKIKEADELIAPAKVASPWLDLNSFSPCMLRMSMQCAKKLITHGVVLLNGPIDRPWGLQTVSQNMLKSIHATVS